MGARARLDVGLRPEIRGALVAPGEGKNPIELLLGFCTWR